MMTATEHGDEALPVHYIRANDLEFAYLEALPASTPNAKAAPLVLVLHGFPDTAQSYAEVVQQLADTGYHAVAPFLRGYQPSELPEDGDYSVLALGRDVIALMEHFGADQAFLVGHDWGALAAYAAAALRPDRIRGIVTFGVPHPRRVLLRPSLAQLTALDYAFKFQWPLWAERRIKMNGFAWLIDLVKRWSPDWTPTEAYLAQLRTVFADPARLKAALAYYRAVPGLLFTRNAWQFLLHPIQAPARVVCGARDACMLPSTFQESEHLFGADYELIEMKGVGHAMVQEAPQEFATLILEFLKRH